MAIRMVEDKEPGEDFNDNSGGGGGGGNMNIPGGGGGLLGLLPLLLGLFKGKKGIFILALLGIAAYFLFFKKGGCLPGGVQNIFSPSGYNYDKDKFLNTDIYEPLDEGNAKNPIRESVDLSSFAPQRGDQGEQGSCVAWSSAYAARTIMEAASKGVSPEQVKFSPSFLYNNIGLEGCQGSYIEKAMDFMQQRGAIPMSQFSYDPSDCSRQPDQSLYQQAQQYRIRGYHRLTNGNSEEISVRAVKEHLDKDAPVVIGMMVGQSFMQGMMGEDVWKPASQDASMIGMGGHAMCVVGYNDRAYGGAFKIMNSWGQRWGKDGFAWVRYADFKNYVREAYGMDPLPKSAAMQNLPLECKIGLVRKDDRKYIALRNTGGNVFETTTPVKMGTRFRVEINNVKECYIYVFAEDGQGSNILFPYTPKHSPFCGITGSRLFPRDFAMQPDSVGVKDHMAVVISKEKIDFAALNTAIRSSTQTGYAAKVADAVRAYKPVNNAKISASSDGTMYVKSDGDPNNLVALIVAVNKTR
jgi:Papain family cysteine protease